MVYTSTQDLWTSGVLFFVYSVKLIHVPKAWDRRDKYNELTIIR
jgi:hypothetical protein